MNPPFNQPSDSLKTAWVAMIEHLQNNICHALEAADGKAIFKEDVWKREEGGGGKTKIIANGNVFEKGGVNTSVVFGKLTKPMQAQLKINTEHGEWFAAGISIVLHPQNPFVPTIHCNYRLFQLYETTENNGSISTQLTKRWFGGGTDLTPYYLIPEDALHFHQTLKNVCNHFHPKFYETFKKNCDDYFVNTHRGNERRGIGGIFYDHQTATKTMTDDHWFQFGKACGHAFLTAYLPIVEKRKNTAYTPAQKHWQEIRRGRYVEFNLIHDRGTLFGLKTNGRIESILMSLPPTVKFEYNHQPAMGSHEYQLLQVCLHPQDWVKK